MSDSAFDDMPLIYQYTRQQAIEDGVLVDLTEWARETGFTIPVACTATVWNGFVVPPEHLRELGQSERGRAHDLLWMLFLSIRRCRDNTDQLSYQVVFLQDHDRHETVTFKSICGPGDQAEPVVTVMMPDED